MSNDQIRPIGVVQEISSYHRGWVTRYTQNNVRYAAKNGGTNPRRALPYICAEVEMDQNPCETGVKKANILKLKHITAADTDRVQRQIEREKRQAAEK